MDEIQSNNHEVFDKYARLISLKTKPKPQDVNLSELGHIIENLECFLAFTCENASNRCNIIIMLTEYISSFGLVPNFDGCEDRDFDSRDFPLVPENAEKCFKLLKALLSEVTHFDTLGKRRFCIHAILLCATHGKKYLWSSYDSVVMCEEFLNALLTCTNHRDLSSLLCDEAFRPTIFKAILKHMRPSLLKDTWMKNPSSCYIFYWILSHVKHPHLAEYLSDVFPPPFMFTSYYAIPQQVIGIKCFDHILDNVPPTLIKINGNEDAIYHTLTPLIYSKEYPIIEILYPCLLKLPMMKQQLNPTYWSQYDHVLHHLLSNLELESNVRFQRIYLSHIHSYIESIPPFKHLKRILKAVSRSLSVYDGPEGTCRIISLKILKTVIKLCWPRMERNCYEITKAIYILLTDLEDNKEHLHRFAVKEIRSLCGECIDLLIACHEEIKGAVCDLVEDPSIPGSQVLKSALEKKT